VKDAKDYYDKKAPELAETWYSNETLIPILREFLDLTKTRNPRILDLGCGPGYESMRLKSLGAQVTGVDFSEESIKIAKEKNPCIHFVTENILDNYSYLGQFDGAVCISIFVHIPNDLLEKCFANLSKALKKGAPVFILVKEGEGRNEKASFTEIDNEKYDIGFYNHTLDELKKYSKENFEFIKKSMYMRDENDLWRYYFFRKK
jgi:2-polyprenyl-3-methyl-5-hydroxy-6-metoxy-1,4-benzoquinol methylase